MWEFCVRRVLHLLSASLFTSCVAATGASPPTVNGTLGHSVSLPPGIPVGPDVTEAEWRRTSPRTMIAKYSKGHIEYFGSEEYKRRVTLHPGDFSLEICDLRREDTGDYEVDVLSSSGAENKTTVRLEVYEPVSGTNITVQNITGTCNLTLTCSVTSGNPTSFRWWRGGEAVGKDSPHHLWEHGETVEVHHTAEVEDVVYRCEARNPGSEGTAQIRLRDVCNITTSESARSNWTKVVIISGGVACAVVVLGIICLVCINRKKSAPGQREPLTQDPLTMNTIYAQVQQPRGNAASRQSPEGSEMVRRQRERLEIPCTVYETVKSPATPVPGPARAKGGARRNPRDSSFQEYETVNYPGVPRLASVRNGGRPCGKSRPL
ncbi:SLAM family member 5-like [Pristis pectinata]|uniref:SLAM family member 5-like n=1 Tax=Pristis pectinata TaxID=685728 RepID=UPI00223E853A|nr:SLAM family member 5-like [Pristis pectinata]